MKSDDILPAKKDMKRLRLLITRVNWLASRNDIAVWSEPKDKPKGTPYSNSAYDKKRLAEFRDMLELHDLFDKAGLDEEARKNYVIRLKNERRKYKAEYSKRPVRQRKDNGRNINYSGSYNGPESNPHVTYVTPKIRVPRKCRKTAWKRFKKLFPNIKIDS